jgi:hypothetical protein
MEPEAACRRDGLGLPTDIDEEMMGEGWWAW